MQKKDNSYLIWTDRQMDMDSANFTNIMGHITLVFQQVQRLYHIEDICKCKLQMKIL